ncbi:PAS sensor protein (plasmid) [Gemmatirosa kalamazoonensis]|uniref:histidine kinase n=1 Tax=Gemmatirosa kalamazoonensis TaxID=861299 RepID=W0RUM1_9BACT|nr:MEDS domain-containing protein [Gemmatirosa kalamazoonensis]AHG93263.1 PAS sensor protein [Gemmatirosa kalamazoonensis]
MKVFDEVLARLSDGCVVLDCGLRVIYANLAAGGVFGGSPDQLLGRSLWDEVPGPIAAAIREPAAQTMATGQGRRLQAYDAADERCFDVRLHPSSDGLLITLADVTNAACPRCAAVTPDVLETGVAGVADLPWGTHICQFYETVQDVLDIALPYFRAGLERDEQCVWAVCDPLTVDAAKDALRRGIVDADHHLAAGNLEVVSHVHCYLDGGTFDTSRVIDAWNARLADALERGHAGLRVSGIEAWLTEQTRAAFMAYEDALSAAIAGQRMIVLCTYPLDTATAAQMFDVARAHQSAVVRRGGRWEAIEVLELAQARAAVQRQNEELERRVAERTQQLAAANEELRREMRERESAEAALRESDEVFRVIADDPSTIIGLYDAAGHRVYASPSARQILGELRENPFDGVHPDDLDAAHLAWQRLLAGERTSFTFRYHRSDGAWLWMEAWSSRVQYRNAPHVLTIIRDVSDRVRAHEQIEAREARFRALVERNDALISIIDERARALYVSPSHTRVLGYTAEELYVMPSLSSLVHPEDLAWVREQFAEVPRRSVASLPRPLRVVTKDGRVRNVLLTFTDRRHDPAVGGVIGNGRDVTDELLLEEQLRQAQKMEAIGQLAGGIAHDFNNLLTVIRGYSDFIRTAGAPNDAHRADAEEIRQAADRAAVLTQQLLAFSRKQVLRPEVMEINLVVGEASRMLGRLLSEDVALDLQLAPDAGAVRADAGQLQQVLLNLAVNARDAMPLGGRLTIATESAVLEREAPAQPTPLSPGRYVRLTVSDTGTGMSPEVLRHAFEPFFTTKEPGKGTGLGLSTVYGIVTQSHGRLRVDSAPAKGTTFGIFFPQAGEPATAPMPAATKPGARGSETVLLVEDDAMVRRLAEATLERAGYRVLTAPNGGDALRLAAGRDGAIDLVITDVVMPGMPGPELAQRLEASQSGLRVLYMSGYADDTMARHGINEERVSFLAKPFTPDELARRVREVLDAG